MRIGIDLGGSHISIGLIEKDNILYKNEHNFSNEEKDNLNNVIEEFLNNEMDSILAKVAEEEIEMVGISVPGRPKNGFIEQASNLKVSNLNLENIINKKTRIKAYTKNDGMCAGLAEKTYGSLRECENGVFLGFGTGIGTAVFLHNRLEELIRGAGHMIIEKNGRKCSCGKNGCYETYASMKVLKTALRNKLGENLSSREILKLLDDEKILKEVEPILQEFIEYMAIGIANFARICSAEIVSIGGSFVYYKDILWERLQNELNEIISKEGLKVKFNIATFSNDAGIVGATLINSL